MSKCYSPTTHVAPFTYAGCPSLDDVALDLGVLMVLSRLTCDLSHMVRSYGSTCQSGSADLP